MAYLDFVNFDPETLDADKRRFAIHWASSPDNSYIAGTKTFPSDPNKALKAAHDWIDDPDVKKFRAQSENENEDLSGLPSKRQMATEIHKMSKDPFTTKEQIEAAKLYVTMLGYMPKPSDTIVTVNHNKVMVIREQLPLNEFEQQLQKQQTKLMTDNESRQKPADNATRH
jgi:hypothetical protein